MDLFEIVSIVRSVAEQPDSAFSLAKQWASQIGPYISVVLLHINVQRFRGGLSFKAHRRLYHSTLGLRVIKKKKRSTTLDTKTSCQPSFRPDFWSKFPPTPTVCGWPLETDSGSEAGSYLRLTDVCTTQL